MAVIPAPRTTALALALFVASAAAWSFPFDAAEPGSPAAIEVDGVALSVWVADEEEERRQGLSDRSGLPADAGLLFIFERGDRHGIWMRRMRFPIDILWLDERRRIVDIKRGATPESFPKVFFPRRDARYVLELNAGFSEAHGIEIGALVRLPETLHVD